MAAETTVTQLKQDATKLSREVYKLIKDFEEKHKVSARVDCVYAGGDSIGGEYLAYINIDVIVR